MNFSAFPDQSLAEAAKKKALAGKLRRMDQTKAGFDAPWMRMLGVPRLLNRNRTERVMKPRVKKMERAVVFSPKALLAKSAATRAIKLANAPK